VIRLRQLAGGVAMNWLAVIATIVSTFLLSPFIVRSLGDTGYGVWVLVTSTIAYLGLLDLGLRGAVTHFLARHHATGDHDLASRSFSTVFQVRLTMGAVTVLATAVIALWIDSMFRIPAEYVAAARWSAVLVGASFAVTLICGIFGAGLAALNRFDVLSGITIAQTVVYAVGTALLLSAGYGLIALAVWQAATVGISNAVQVWSCRRIYPQLRLRFERRIDTALLREIWTFSFYIVVISVSGYLIYFSGNIITGAFISAAAVTTYSIAVRLIEYHRQIATSLAQVFMPLASSMHAQQDAASIHRLLLYGTRAAVLVSWPIQAVLFFRGATFIDLWMGHEYGAASGAVLQILLISNFLVVGNGVAANITFGLGKHKPFALWQSAEAAVNVTLSIWLVRGLGLGVSGVAWGVTLPSCVSHGLLWPAYITRLVDYPIRRFLLQAWIRPALAVMPFAAACAWTEHYWPAARLDVLFLQICAILPLYAAGLVLTFRREFLHQWRTPDSIMRRRIIQPLRLRTGI
jgi:O-antigen/teichoic acid export membrane protein